MMLATKAGCLSQRVVDLLGLDYPAGAGIYVGSSNIKHMEESHPRDYALYGGHIAEIIAEPDYVGLNEKDASIEYVKDFSLAGEHVKVAVRTSTRGVFYVRSVYTLNRRRVENFIKKGTLKKY